MIFESFKFEETGESIRIPVAQSYKDCIQLIRSDYFRVYGHRASLFKIWLKSFRNYCIKYLLWMRLASYRQGILFLLCKHRQEHFSKKYGISIPPSTKIGWGFYIGHGFAIVINERTIIGNNVNIGQSTTIGTNDGLGALIGNEVYIGPNTCVIGNVKIGSRALIGAGAVVTKSIEADSTAVGVPSKVVGANKHPEYIGNKWPESL